ncbi:hypothetical protein E3P92_02624 [Wallemia ichthyophaga]|nr:hypothetical protein E3P91_02575 [Wallemia ichthyophaga]TIA80980.1 hypothetical protein E3P98_02378 [Wallemia ichthyophaga]TIA90015.1 hypothetical protein E3P97_02764 [Wallemia ichthyophaga]TIA98686.1 hypothetical protein E3P95_02344 [Wallemia ichthyophaga]TIA99700.1 hypothetical protein E3P94_02469 [Wallemia ichthyophaga]
MSRLSYSQLEFELEQGTGDQQLKRIQAKYGIAAKRQLLNRVAKLETAHAIGKSSAELDARRTVFRLSHDQLAGMISQGAKWAEIGREAGVRSTYAQAVWASIQDNYPGIKYAHGKGRGRNGHPVTDQDKNSVLLFRQGHITRAQAYESLTACGRTRGGAKQILNKYSHSNLDNLTVTTQRPRAQSNASISSIETSYDQQRRVLTPPLSLSSSNGSSLDGSPESGNEANTAITGSTPKSPVTPISLPISSLLQPEGQEGEDEEPPKLRSDRTGLGLRLSEGYGYYYTNKLPPISVNRMSNK